MRRTRSLDLVPIDLDIEKTLRRLRRERKEIDLHKVPVMGEVLECYFMLSYNAAEWYFKIL